MVYERVNLPRKHTHGLCHDNARTKTGFAKAVLLHIVSSGLFKLVLVIVSSLWLVLLGLGGLFCRFRFMSLAWDLSVGLPVRECVTPMSVTSLMMSTSSHSLSHSAVWQLPNCCRHHPIMNLRCRTKSTNGRDFVRKSLGCASDEMGTTVILSQYDRKK